MAETLTTWRALNGDRSMCFRKWPFSTNGAKQLMASTSTASAVSTFLPQNDEG
jgi:hypothetical protein